MLGGIEVLPVVTIRRQEVGGGGGEGGRGEVGRAREEEKGWPGSDRGVMQNTLVQQFSPKKPVPQLS